MSACCGHSLAAGRFFSRFARFCCRHYRRHGLETCQRQLLAGLRRTGIDSATLLEIGCGVGYLHQALLAAGAVSATGIDLSAKMLEQAAELAQSQGLGSRTRYLQGDFVVLSGELEAADVVILDKVICCYPDAELLLTKALSKTRRCLALTYPRDHLLNRASMALINGLLRLFRSDFRNYLHDPVRVRRQLQAAGLERLDAGQTLIWRSEVYFRP